ncbi:hypothetical protein SAMN05428988_1761 [Chitinophaga sp. YR573]|uniref:MBL fold metallo-hydrolase n=1 Tax=Chitinophaga sp. YR573 TaxID=1881040 RepID=UPI0008D18F4E|nr:MBL fold metallo-hydrolase [Chitinophaga sp. YR573]SEW07017.1 hypothetical protein SAMN05428988_1761 [Chitinophaga sp. YR573]
MICTTCGTQYPQTPERCNICNDDRQYINVNGQSWISFDELRDRHEMTITQVCDKLYSLQMDPGFALSNRALLVQSASGNILWDCVPLLNDKTIAFINSIGGLKAIAFSHPHYYSTMNEWAAAFNCPIYIHENDKPFIEYFTASIHLWNNENLHLWDGISIIHTGGHFPGSCVLKVPFLSAQGTILCGDSIYISPSKRHTAVMYSYPNQILLSKSEFSDFYKRTAGLSFDTMYGAFKNQDLEGNAMQVFTSSMQRYINTYG